MGQRFINLNCFDTQKRPHASKTVDAIETAKRMPAFNRSMNFPRACSNIQYKQKFSEEL